MAISETARQANLLDPSSYLRQADFVAELYSREHKTNIGIYQMTFGLINVIDPDEIKPTLTKYGFTYDDFMRNVRFMRQSEFNSPEIGEKQKPSHTPHLRMALILANSLAREERWNEIEAEHLLIGIARYSQAQYDKQTSNENPQNIDEIIQDEAAD